MVPFLYTPREHHLGVATPAQYLARHASFMARKARAGQQFRVHESPAPCVAYVSANTWVIDCECGAGNATDPAWGLACCFGCGAVHRTVIFPADAPAITQALLARVNPQTRHWLPGETVDQLIAENGIVARAHAARKGGR